MEQEELKMDYFPTVQEIINNVALTRCDECGRIFQNASACRFHQLKQHLMLDVSNSNERRLFKKNAAEPRVIMAFHCPDPLCQSKKAWFDGIRNLKQHYFRAHGEKNLMCEKCNYKTALEKDLNYHRKVRCPMIQEKLAKKALLKAEKAKGPHIPKKRRKRNDAGITKDKTKRKPSESSDDEEQEETSSRSSTSPQPSSSLSHRRSVIQPIFFIVNAENVHQVVDTLQKGLQNPAEVSLNNLERELQQANIPYIDSSESIPVIPTSVNSTSFATQYEEPATYCERGTMMNGEPLDYFDPPYGAEFGDMTPRSKTQAAFDYTTGPSTSQQPQTRSFGTMFENVTTCNTGTSTIDEAYVSEFLRDIETQTPNFMPPAEQHQQSSSQSSHDWTSSWRMTDGDI